MRLLCNWIVKGISIFGLLILINGCVSTDDDIIKSQNEKIALLEKQINQMKSGEDSKSDNKAIGYLPRCDGVYQSDKIDNHFEFIRFYKDSTVFTVSAEASPQHIFNWLKKENIGKGISNGRYEIRDNLISFTSTSNYGTVEYHGTIHDMSMVLNWYSHINGNKGKKHYFFIHVENK
jgi:hypothetical protein